MKRLFVTLLSIVFITSISLAGIKMEMKTSSASNSSMTIEMSNSQMKISYVDGNDRGAMIYNNVNKKMTIIDEVEKTYFHITKQQLQLMKVKLKKAMTEAEAMLQHLPPEQRALAQQMLGGQMPSVEPEEITYHATGNAQLINGWSCDEYRMKSNGQEEGKVWSATYSTLGISKSDFDVMLGFSEFMAEMTDDIIGDMGMDNPMAYIEGLNGVPIKSITDTGEQTEIISLKKIDIASSVFKVPAGYTENSLF